MKTIPKEIREMGNQAYLKKLSEDPEYKEKHMAALNKGAAAWREKMRKKGLYKPKKD